MRKRLLVVILMLALLMSMPGLPAQAAAVRVKLDQTSVTVDMAEQKTLQLTGTLTQATKTNRIVWRSGKTSRATITQSGLVTLKSTGTVTVGARPYGAKAWTLCKINIKDSDKPTKMTLSSGNTTLSAGATLNLSAELYPASAVQTVRFVSKKPSVASVTSDGTVLAKKSGTTYIRVTSTYNPSLRKTIRVKVSLIKPKKITITPTTKSMVKGAALQLSAAVSPSTAGQSVKWTSLTPAVASVTEDGLVTAIKAGTAKIKCASTVKSSVYTIRTITVSDPNAVSSVNINVTDDIILDKGEAFALKATVLPAGTSASVEWESSNTSVATVSSAGKISGVGVGSATITATAGSKSDNVEVTVLAPRSSYATAVQAAYVTDADDVSANRKKINNIYKSAVSELTALYAEGTISNSERTDRKNVLARAFTMADFPWTSTKNVTYWSNRGAYYAANRIYFGMPYTQTNRTYNVARLLAKNYFTQNGVLYTTETMPSISYHGNDCSSFASMSSWNSGSYAFLNSTAMFTSAGYKTVATKTGLKSAWQSLRPGDLFVRKGHAVVFLYYTNTAKTSVMVIEQGGGSEPNTVLCRVRNLAYYSNSEKNYIARRKATY